MKIKILFGAVVAVVFVSLSFQPVAAQTVQQLQAQIQVLMQQITVLQAKIAANNSPIPPMPIPPIPTDRKFQVLRPIEGAAYSLGERMGIIWTYPAAKGPFSLLLYENGNKSEVIAYLTESTANCALSSGSCFYSWIVDVPGYSTSSVKMTYRIAITDSTGQTGWSGNFTVGNSSPKITSVSSKGQGPNQLVIGRDGYIVGTGFLANNTLTIDGWSANVSSTNSTLIIFTVPTLAPGPHVLNLKNANGNVPYKEAVVFFVPPPTISTVSTIDSNTQLASVLSSLQALIQHLSTVFGF